MLGKRDVTSRIPEIQSSVIGRVGRVAQNLQFDINEVNNRHNRKNAKNAVTSLIGPAMDIQVPLVACVQENEAAMYYRNTSYDDKGARKRVGSIGKQAYVWTCVNGHYIQRPEGFEGNIEFKSLPDEVQLEFIEKGLQFRGLIGTSWQQGSDMSKVTPPKFPVVKAGTAMINLMYPTVIAAGDIIGVSFPTKYDLKHAAATPNRNPNKYLMAFKTMREIEALHDKAISTVLLSAGRVAAATVLAGAPGGRYIPGVAQGTTNFSLDSYTCWIMNMLPADDIDPQAVLNSTTPFRLLWQAMKQNWLNLVEFDFLMQNSVGAAAARSPDVGRLVGGGPYAFNTECVRVLVLQMKASFEILSNRRKMLESRTVGIALTSAHEGLPCDIILGRGKST